MNKFLLAAAVLAVASPVQAQTTQSDSTTPTPPANTANSGTTPPPAPSTNATSTTTSGAVGSSEAPPPAPPSPIEQNRLDPSAPSRYRLQIDGGSSGSVASNPDTTSSDPAAPGESYNALTEGTPSNNGVSSGSSGLGVAPTPSPLSESPYPPAITTPPTPYPTSTYPAPLVQPTPFGTHAGVVVEPNSTFGSSGFSSQQSTSPMLGGVPSVGAGTSSVSHSMPRAGAFHSGGGHR